MLWAAACTGFFGFLRAGEFTIPTAQGYNPDMHLSLQGLAVENPSDPTLFCIRIKHSKTDPFRQGADILYLGATHVSICPVQALIDFIAVRSPEPGPIFVYQLATPLTRIKLVCEVLETLRQAGIPPTADTGQSFRIGAATTAAKRGMQDSLIQTLGRWKSAAYHARNLHP